MQTTKPPRRTMCHSHATSAARLDATALTLLILAAVLAAAQIFA